MDIALAIHVFRKSQRLWLVNGGLMLITAIGYAIWSPTREVDETEAVVRGYPMAASLMLALFAFHFTEGSRRAGFGAFPMRLFVLPMSTIRLVAIPMACGVVTIVGVYLIWARMILPMANVHPHLLRPCLFLGAASLGFQALVWVLAKYQTAKLFGLGVFGTLMACSWVLLKEEIAIVVVRAVAPSLRVDQAVALLLVSIASAGFFTGYITVYRQRHRSFATGRGNFEWLWKRLSVRLELERRFMTPDAALFWHEWRLMGRVLPMAVALVCGFLLLLSLGISHVSEVATVNVMLVLFMAPVSLAAVLGAEYGKPNFWSSGLVQIPYLLTQPIAHSAYVMARIKVAVLSAGAAWGIAMLSLVVWAAVFADAAIIHWLESVAGMSYGPIGWLALVGFLLLLGMVVTIRLLCGDSWLTLFGRENVYSSVTTAKGLVGIVGLIALIFVPDWKGDRIWLAHAVHWFSLLLCLLGIVHGVLIAVVWSRVLRAEQAAVSQFRQVWICALLSGGLIGWLGYEAVTEVDWIRLLCWQFALWSFPALGCGLGIAARMQGTGCPMLPSLRKGPIMLGCLWIGLSIVLGILAGRSLPIVADTGGHQVRMMIRGSGTPVVVLEQFGPGPLEPWAKIQNRIAEFATVVIYEHAGGAASGFGLPPRDANKISRELRDALRSAGLEPPFVMVGYSFGGPYVRVFAGKYPEDVAGLVLVDPSTEAFFEWLWKEDPKSHRISARHRQMQNEMGMVEESFSQATAAGIPQVPTVVLTGGKARDTVTGRRSMSRWIAAQSNWVAQLPNGRHVISRKSGHAIPFREPERVVEVVREVVESVRLGTD